MLRPLSPANPDDEIFEGLLILRPEGRIYFVNAQNIADKINALVDQYRPRVVALDMSRVPDLNIRPCRCSSRGRNAQPSAAVTLWLAALNPTVLKVVRQSGLAERAWQRTPAVQRPCGDHPLPDG